MKRLASILAAVLALAAAVSPGAAGSDSRPQTIPALRSWAPHPGSFHLGPSTRIIVAADRARSLLPVARVLAGDLGATIGRRPEVLRGARPGTGDILLRLTGGDSSLGPQGYEINISSGVRLTARRPAGVFEGTRSLLQLAHQSTSIPAGSARDWPRYPQRGLMLDLGRNPFKARWIVREIKRLAYLKLNLLHLHLTDDQRWGVESKTHPELASPGALTEAQMRRILAVAARYHVEVVPEIDLPGHSGALLAKHPGLELTPNGTPPLASVASKKLDITDPRALRIVRRVLDEYMRLFPGRYFEIGADEYLAPSDVPYYPQLASFAEQRYGSGANAQDALLGFINWADRIAHRHGKTLRAWNDQLSPGAVLTVNRDVVADWWTDVSPLSEPQAPTATELLAGGHRVMNDGWFPTYPNYFGGPATDLGEAYEAWSVNQFCGAVFVERIRPCEVISPRRRRNLGSAINAWEQSQAQLSAGDFHRLSLAVIAQKTWDSPPLTPDFGDFEAIADAVGEGAR